MLEGDVSNIQRKTQQVPQEERSHTGDKACKQLLKNLQDLFNQLIEVVQSGAGKLAKNSQGMSKIKGIWYFQLAKILQFSCLLADQADSQKPFSLPFFLHVQLQP